MRMKVTPTCVGFDGVGYFRGEDGKYYYGTMGKVLTCVDREPDPPKPPEPDVFDAMDEALDQSLSSKGGDGVGVIGGFFSLLAYALAGVAAIAFIGMILAYLLIMMPIFFMFGVILLPWPFFLGVVVNDLQRGAFGVPDIIVLGATAVLAVFLLICIAEVLMGKGMRMKRCFLVHTVVMTLVNGLFALAARSLSPLVILIGMALAVLPTLIVAFCEHLVTKKQRNDRRWFITRIGECVVPYFPGHSIGMLLVGAVTVLFVVKVMPREDFMVFLSFMIPGVLLFIIGLQAKLKVLLGIGSRVTPDDYEVAEPAEERG